MAWVTAASACTRSPRSRRDSGSGTLTETDSVRERPPPSKGLPWASVPAAVDGTAAMPTASVGLTQRLADRKSTRLNSSHQIISYAVFCLKKKKTDQPDLTS